MHNGERFMTLRLTRRAAFGLAFACGLLLGSGAAFAEKIVISNWDGYMPADLLANFTKETGIEAEMSVHATNEEIMGKVVAGGGKGYDVLFVSSPFVEALQNLQLIAPLDAAKIPNLANLYPEARALAYDPGNAHSVPYAWGTTGLCYRSDLIKTAPTSWMDLLQPSADIKGRITMLATDRWLMAAGEKALGYSVNTTNEDEIAKTKALLIEAKKNLLAYDDTTFYSKLVSSEAVLVQAWDGWCNYGIAENAAIKFVVPKEGSDMWVDTMVVTAASEHKDAAMAFINYVLRPEIHRWVAENILYKVPNQKAMEGLDPKLIEQYPNIGMTPAELMKQEQLRDLGKAQKDYTRAVTEITSAQ
ncbi:spermidine/putrescine ABC transporter substrate-binding protein [Hypericibacter terrae]|uniref:Putrescine-binding periplasmic protein n=2 Tax=Hypericibacter terrae TaxID=2602015 RepID=A0A5J6MSH6_9PROT|nr:spermidine/putrescine ABC transporter substrate-binding protein [Hypericibacter terrae]